MVLPQPVLDLLSSVEVRGVPPRLNQPGDLIKLSIDPSTEAFTKLVGEQSIGGYKLDLDRVDLPGLLVDDKTRTLGLDLGSLLLAGADGADSLKLDLGSLSLVDSTGAPGLTLDLGKLTPRLALDIGKVLTDLKTQLSGATGATDGHMVAKFGEFSTFENAAANLDTAASADGGLPYAVPQAGTSPALMLPGTKTSGLVGKIRWALDKLLGTITGSIQQDSAALGGISGTVTHDPDTLGELTGGLSQRPERPGSIAGALNQDPTKSGQLVLPSLAQKIDPNTKLPQALGYITGALKRTLLSNVTLTVKWVLSDENGNVLTPGKHYLITAAAVPGEELTQLAPQILFLPEFVEFVGIDADLVTLRGICCEVTVGVQLPNGTTDSFTRQIGPAFVAVPKVQVPSVVVLTEHAVTDTDNFPGSVLVAVPEFSGIEALGLLESPLKAVQGVTKAIRDFAALIGWKVPLFAGVPRTTELLLQLLDTPHFVKGDIVELRQAVIARGFLGVVTKKFEDIVSSIIMLGPPGREAKFHVWEALWYRGGVLRLTLGELSPAAVIPDLVSASVLEEPSEGLTDSVVTIDVPPDDSEGRPAGTFNDCLSSFRFLPVAGKVEAPAALKRLTAQVTHEPLVVTVHDEDSGTPLAGASVTLRNGTGNPLTQPPVYVNRTLKTGTEGTADFGSVELQAYPVRVLLSPDEPDIYYVNPSIKVSAEGYLSLTLDM